MTDRLTPAPDHIDVQPPWRRGEISSRGGRMLPRDRTELELVRAARALLDDREDPDRIRALIVAVGRYL